MKSLRSIALLPYEYGSSPIHYSVDTVLRAMEVHGDKLLVSSGKFLSVSEVRDRFAPWRPVRPRIAYDVCISHSEESLDTEFARSLFDRLSLESITTQNRPVHALLDCNALKLGDNINTAFTSALLNSSVVVVVVSPSALARLSLIRPEDELHFLVDWLLAIEAYAAKVCIGVLRIHEYAMADPPICTLLTNY